MADDNNDSINDNNKDQQQREEEEEEVHDNELDVSSFLDELPDGARVVSQQSSLNFSQPKLVGEPSLALLKTTTDRGDDSNRDNSEKETLLNQLEKDAAMKRKIAGGNRGVGLASNSGPPSKPGAFVGTAPPAMQPGAYSAQGEKQEGKRLRSTGGDAPVSKTNLVQEPSRVVVTQQQQQRQESEMEGDQAVPRHAVLSIAEKDAMDLSAKKKNAKAGLAGGRSSKPGAYSATTNDGGGGGGAKRTAPMADPHREVSFGSTHDPAIVSRTRMDNNHHETTSEFLVGAHAASGPLPNKHKSNSGHNQPNDDDNSAAIVSSMQSLPPMIQYSMSDSIPGAHTSMSLPGAGSLHFFQKDAKKGENHNGDDDYARDTNNPAADGGSYDSLPPAAAPSPTQQQVLSRQQDNNHNNGGEIQQTNPGIFSSGADLEVATSARTMNSQSTKPPSELNLTGTGSNANLIEAELVQERSRTNILVSAVEVDEDEGNKPIYKHKQFAWVAAGGGCLCLVIIIIVVAVVVSSLSSGGGGDDDSSQSSVVTLAPSTAAPTGISPDLEAIQSRVEPLLDDPSQLENTTSAYYKAFRWMVYTDETDPTYKHLEERYLMATFYYLASAQYEWRACAFTEWADTICMHPEFKKSIDEFVDVRSNRWLSAAQECDWAGLSCHGGGEGLKRIELDTYDLNGILLPEIGHLTALETLELKDNPDLKGPLPTSLGLLPELHKMFLPRNGFTGTLPNEICTATDMQEMDVAENDLNGTIPTCLWQLTRLEKLALDENEFTGTIPSEIGLLSNLQEAEFDDNNLHGTVPEEICSLTLDKLRVDCGSDDVENFVACSAPCDCSCI